MSLYAGAEMEGSERLAQIGGTPAVAAFGAREGTLLITFTSDGSNQRAGFTAEYWCTSPDVLGCADPSAANFSPAAAAGDGSCVFPDTYGEGAALRAGFGVPYGPRGWAGLRGWGDGGRPCGGAAAAGAVKRSHGRA